MVEPGYRDAPGADEPVAFVYVKARCDSHACCVLLQYCCTCCCSISAAVMTQCVENELLSLTLLLVCAVPSSCPPLHLPRDALLLLCLLLPPPLQISKPAEVQEAEQVRPAVSDDTILR